MCIVVVLLSIASLCCKLNTFTQKVVRVRNRKLLNEKCIYITEDKQFLFITLLIRNKRAAIGYDCMHNPMLKHSIA